MSEHFDDNNQQSANGGAGGGVGEDLQKLMMAGLGAVVHLKEKSVVWFDEMAQKGRESAQDMQPTIDEMAKKGKEALDCGMAIGADAVAKLQRTIDGLKQEAKQIDLDEITDSINGLTDDALHAVRAKIDELIEMRANSKCDCDDKADDSCCDTCEDSNPTDPE